jgi:hypothetical protein
LRAGWLGDFWGAMPNRRVAVIHLTLGAAAVIHLRRSYRDASPAGYLFGMPDRATICIAGDCQESAVAFKHFPTVRGYCAEHGWILAEFLAELWPASYYTAHRDLLRARLGVN